MGLYKDYFDHGLMNRGYEALEEALEDMMALVDVHLTAAFYGKEICKDRMEMRGLVITPAEFETALEEGTLEARNGPRDAEAAKRREGIREEIELTWLHVESRAARSPDSRLWKLLGEFSLSRLELLCFFLALSVEYDRKYERLYGYLQDNVAVRLPTVGLGLSLHRLGGGDRASWLPGESPLWQSLLRSEPEADEKESRLSRVLQVREDLYLYMREGRWGHRDEMGPYAVYVKTVYEWEDLILEEEQKELMRQICGHVRYRDQVMNEWGFGSKSPYGNGVSAIFHGPPGTGKTMAAQVIARELGMELYKIDLSRLTSKYIGETEKNLAALFDLAAVRQVVLFFDEADSLFAKRSEVSSSNDRYANMETGFLLQRFEEHDGITILATNYINNIDEAFKRRIKYMVRFPFPSEASRLCLWRSMMPDEAPLEEDPQYALYAKRFELPGSGIKEIITNSAYLAAAGGHGIRNEDIRHSIRLHYLKWGKRLTREELNE